MVDIKGSKSIYNRAQIDKIIVDSGSITLAFFEGYVDPDIGEFVPLGSDHITITEKVPELIQAFAEAGTKDGSLAYAETFIPDLIAFRNSKKSNDITEQTELTEGEANGF